MRIHTSATYTDLLRAQRAAGVVLHATEHASRTHTRAFEVGLEGSGGRTNGGWYGAGDRQGATWDEWGVFFANLYEADPAARCGGSAKRPVYADGYTFHLATGDRFADLTMPADTHPRHRWVTVDGDARNGWKCAKCSATQPSRHSATGQFV